MVNPTIEELLSEIQRLRILVTSLGATLLRNAALDQLKDNRILEIVSAEYLVREAEECFRCARIPELRKEIATGLEVAGNELMSKAVEIDTLRQRGKRDN
jgi:hypothetical protein